MAVSPSWGHGVTVPISVDFGDVGGALGFSPAPPSAGDIFYPLPGNAFAGEEDEGCYN